MTYPRVNPEEKQSRVYCIGAGGYVNPEKPLCPRCEKPATHESSHAIATEIPYELAKKMVEHGAIPGVHLQEREGKAYSVVGWWSGWYCKECNIIFCHHPACQLPDCIKAKELQPEYRDLI